MLQQPLPFTVLKRSDDFIYYFVTTVATALTVYGIETQQIHFEVDVCILVATALTVYGIVTYLKLLKIYP